MKLIRPQTDNPGAIRTAINLAFDQLEKVVGTGGTSPLTTKGDVYTHDATVDTRLPVGTNGFVLTADSTQTTGLKWAAAAGGAFVPTGTGFFHATAGVEDAATKLVDTADINNDQVTYAKIQNVVTNNRILGRVSGAGGDIEELSGNTVTGLLITFSTVLNGLVPAPGVSTGKFLRDDASWATVMTPPTGTGFPHITAGVEDAAAKLVDTADINANQVTYPKLQVESGGTMLGRAAGPDGTVTELFPDDIVKLTKEHAGLYDPGLSLVIGTGHYVVMADHLTLTGAESLTLTGDAVLRIV